MVKKSLESENLSLVTYKLAYACINFIQPNPSPPPPPFPQQTLRTRFEGSKNPSLGTITVHKNPHLGTKQGVKSPTLKTKYLQMYQYNYIL